MPPALYLCPFVPLLASKAGQCMQWAAWRLTRQVESQKYVPTLRKCRTLQPTRTYGMATADRMIGSRARQILAYVPFER